MDYILVCLVVFAVARWRLRSAKPRQEYWPKAPQKVYRPQREVQKNPIHKNQWLKDGYLMEGDKVVSELLPSEQAGVSLLETFHPEQADDYLDSILVLPERAERSLAWMREDAKRAKAFVDGGRLPLTNNVW
jgi:hypothetical protein